MPADSRSPPLFAVLRKKPSSEYLHQVGSMNAGDRRAMELGEALHLELEFGSRGRLSGDQDCGQKTAWPDASLPTCGLPAQDCLLELAVPDQRP